MKERVNASPTKDFFISMITRDINLEDCILDLLDNSIDGARSILTGKGIATNDGGRFKGFRASITITSDQFSVSDNCGGMSVEQAKNYAFHFGRRKDAQPGAPRTIGLYGIGMKRAMFKIGRMAMVKSSTETEAFVVPIDVSEWAKDETSWDFELELRDRDAKGEPGTDIEIVDLIDGVGEEFGDPVFVDNLIAVVARDYSLILREGFEVLINGVTVKPFLFGWLTSEYFEPVRQVYQDGAVTVEVRAGLSRVPPDDDQAGDPERPDTRYYGWFIACNDRVVLAGNKDDRTVWGDEGFPGWHTQYYGFTGIVNFRADDPRLLPWTTTKRDVDSTAPVYRRAVTRMKEATRPYIDYTNARKQDLEEAKRRESAAQLNAEPPMRLTMKLPVLADQPVVRVKIANIAYSVPERDYLAVAEALGSQRLPRKEVGLRTFTFFKERMVDSDE